MDCTSKRINFGSNSPSQHAEAGYLACKPDIDALLAYAPELARAWDALPRRTLHKGEALVNIGEPVDRIWRIETGLLRMFYLSAQGQERNRSFHAEGQWVGCGIPPIVIDSMYAVEALEACTLTEVPYQLLQVQSAKHLHIQAALESYIANVFKRQTRREEELLLLNATDRYAAFLEWHGSMAARLPLHHVASYLGITNVALSRLRRKIKQR